jgi:uncharacterized membrane protein/heme-degrading monooxygenase HmoA
MLAGGAVLVGIAAATGELTRATPGHVSTQSLAALAYLIGPGSLLALTCYVIALRRLPPTVVSTYAYINPVVAVSLGALILGERLTLTALLGGAIIVASVALLLTHQARHPPQTRNERPFTDRPGKDTRMIARIWRGAVRADDAAAYASYIQETGIEGYKKTPGNRGAWALCRADGDQAEFITVSLWDSWQAIQSFAGQDIEKAVFYPEDDRFLVERDLTVRHYEVAATE